MSEECSRATASSLGAFELHNVSVAFFVSLLGTDCVSVRLSHSASGASVVAIDNKIEQAMDLVKSHLMFAVREEVEVLKDQIKELVERNSHLERENSALKGLASPEQLRDIQAQLTGRQQRAIGGAPSSLTP
ncbi:unnamed protein product [Lampetra planeri]